MSIRLYGVIQGGINKKNLEKHKQKKYFCSNDLFVDLINGIDHNRRYGHI